MTYIYHQQIKEAGLILINKMDLIDPSRADVIESACREINPTAVFYRDEARRGDHLAPLFEAMLTRDDLGPPLFDLDYSTYGEGESQLGWLNAVVKVSASSWRDGNDWLKTFCQAYAQSVKNMDSEIAHLKLTLAPSGLSQEIASVSLVDNDQAPVMTASLSEEFQEAELIINMRAQARPDTLQEALDMTMSNSSHASDIHLSLEHIECFSPAAPSPTPERNATFSGETS